MSLGLILIVAGLALLAYGFLLKGKDVSLYDQTSSAEQTDHTTSEQENLQGTNVPEGDAWYGPVLIYYSTQTGTAAKFAKSLCKELKESKILSSVACISECSVEAIKKNLEALHIFVVATHYEGESPDDMQVFWKEMKSTNQKELFAGLKYTGFALGDLNYKYFCQTGRLLNKKLEQLGGQLAYVFGEGSNDQGRIHEFFEEWAIPVSTTLLSHVQPIPEDRVQTLLETLDDGTFVLSLDNENSITGITDPARYDPAVANYLTAHQGEVIAVNELRQLATPMDSTLQVDIRLPAGVTYKTAENLKVYPENNRSLVQKALECVGMKFDTKVKFEAKGKLPFPNKTSAGELLSKYVDLQGKLSKATVKSLRDMLPATSTEVRKE